MIDYFDVDLAINSGVCSFAGRQKGKTNLMKLLVRELLNKGVIVTVFDPSQAWTRNTPIKNLITVTPELTFESIPDISIVYDVSRLTRPDSQMFVNGITAHQMERQINSTERKPHFNVYEEAQIYLNRGSINWLEEIYRLVSIGANYLMSYGLISQRPASVDVEAISRCAQIYLGSMWESNDLRKIKNYLNYSRTETYEVMTHLPVGCFVYLKDGKKRIISVPLFKGITPQDPIVKKRSLIARILSRL